MHSSMILENIFTERVVNLWNSLPSLFVEAPSLNCFKTGLDRFWSLYDPMAHDYILRESQTTQNVLWSRASVCLSVCLSVAACPHYCTDPDVTWGNGRGCPLVVQYWADLQSVHGFRCYDNMARMAKCQRVLVLALRLVDISDQRQIIVIGCDLKITNIQSLKNGLTVTFAFF